MEVCLRQLNKNFWMPNWKLSFHLPRATLAPNKPKVEDMLPLVLRIERRLVSTLNFLTHAGRLEMVNSMLSSLPIYYMSIIKLPPTIIK
jgi:hypothetical protein